METYKETFPNTPLVDTTAILKTYSGEKITPEGKLPVRVEHNNQVKDLNVICSENTRAAVVWKRLATPDPTGLEKDVCYFKRTANTRHPEEIRDS